VRQRVVVGDQPRRALPVGRIGHQDRGGGIGVVFLPPRDEGLFEEGAEAFAARQAEGLTREGEEPVGERRAQPLEFGGKFARLEGAVDGLFRAASGGQVDGDGRGHAAARKAGPAVGVPVDAGKAGFAAKGAEVTRQRAAAEEGVEALPFGCFDILAVAYALQRVVRREARGQEVGVGVHLIRARYAAAWS